MARITRADLADRARRSKLSPDHDQANPLSTAKSAAGVAIRRGRCTRKPVPDPDHQRGMPKSRNSRRIAGCVAISRICRPKRTLIRPWGRRFAKYSRKIRNSDIGSPCDRCKGRDIGLATALRTSRSECCGPTSISHVSTLRAVAISPVSAANSTPISSNSADASCIADISDRMCAIRSLARVAIKQKPWSRPMSRFRSRLRRVPDFIYEPGCDVCANSELAIFIVLSAWRVSTRQHASGPARTRLVVQWRPERHRRAVLWAGRIVHDRLIGSCHQRINPEFVGARIAAGVAMVSIHAAARSMSGG